MEKPGHAANVWEMAPTGEAGQDGSLFRKEVCHQPCSPTSCTCKYPPADEGMVQLVLAPTMQRIKAILPEKVGALLTKAWI